MEDFFSNKFVIAGTFALSFGFIASMILKVTDTDVSYQFQYSYIENIEDSKTETIIKKCIVFDSKELDLSDAKKIFLKNNVAGGKLTVNDGCDTDLFGDSVYEKIRIE